LAAAAALGAFVGLVACSSDPPPAPSFCELARSAASTCGASPGAPCDTTLTDGCHLAEKALSPSAQTATRDCLESGVCGVTSCLARAQANARPSRAHEALAVKYCATCAPDDATCTTAFYAKRSKLPGRLVLPYAESIAKAVEDACTAHAATCRATFSTCATETVARLTREATSEPIAACLTERRDDAEAEGLGTGGFTLATCTPDNCRGCCREDKCEEGSSNASCGSGAVSCQTCSGLQRCKDGTCQEPCGPTNCDGCCDGDICGGGTARDRCGEGGAECVDCATSGGGFVCSSQKCIDASCRVTCTSGCCSSAGCQAGTSPSACGTNGEACVNCGAGRTCNPTSRTCALDTASTWDFFVSSAALPSTTKGGSAWDLFGGLPDPYLRAFSSEGASTHNGQTPTRNDTVSPAYGVAPLRGIRASELISNTFVDVWDEDFDFDDLIGGCRIPISTGNFDGRLYSFTCAATPDNGEVRIVFRLLKSP
jgi:hypothetical protein